MGLAEPDKLFCRSNFRALCWKIFSKLVHQGQVKFATHRRVFDFLLSMSEGASYCKSAKGYSLQALYAFWIAFPRGQSPLTEQSWTTLGLCCSFHERQLQVEELQNRTYGRDYSNSIACALHSTPKLASKLFCMLNETGTAKYSPCRTA